MSHQPSGGIWFAGHPHITAVCDPPHILAHCGFAEFSIEKTELQRVPTANPLINTTPFTMQLELLLTGARARFRYLFAEPKSVSSIHPSRTPSGPRLPVIHLNQIKAQTRTDNLEDNSFEKVAYVRRRGGAAWK